MASTITTHSASAMENKKEELADLIEKTVYSFSTQREALELIFEINKMQSIISSIPENEADIIEEKELYDNLETIVSFLREIAFPNQFSSKQDHETNEMRTVLIVSMVEHIQKEIIRLKPYQVIQNNNNNKRPHNNMNNIHNNNNNNQESEQNKKIKIDIIEKEECAICLDELDNNTQKALLQCFHKFHKSCIDDCFKNKKECPICRTKVDGYNEL